MRSRPKAGRLRENFRNRGIDMLNIDANLVNADWTKATWDLPPEGSKEFNELLKSTGLTLAQFKKLPASKGKQAK